MNLFTLQLFFPYLSAKVFLLQTENKTKGKHCNLKSPFCFVLNTIFGNLGELWICQQQPLKLLF